jgi:hypothetical protein
MTTLHVFDIDGTIADNSHREHLLKKSCLVCLSVKGAPAHSHYCAGCDMETSTHIDQASWDSFLHPELVSKDPVYKGSLDYTNALRNGGQMIHFITGRNYKLFDASEEWLTTKFEKRAEESLTVRSAEEDGIPAWEYKEQALKRLLFNLGLHQDTTTIYLYEDDPRIWDMYSRYGIVVRCPDAWKHIR